MELACYELRVLRILRINFQFINNVIENTILRKITLMNRIVKRRKKMPFPIRDYVDKISMIT